jgi:acetyl-CoA/propionyl-CoA carboxylase biotin carboxyl carrier protein
VLIANRGEIAVRIIRTLREMGITSVAAFSDADRDAPFVHQADEAYRLGAAPPADSYLNIDALLIVAREAGVDAIHPGYGFLAENAAFAEAVAGTEVTFIGPSPDAMRLMGDKVRARGAVGALGVPLVPGTDGPVRDLDQAREFGRRTGYPLAVKAAGGGGGRGIRVVRRAEDLEEALEGASREAAAYFKNPEVYLEQYFDDPRHVEIQVLGDTHGTLLHLGERDCSVQRRHQKLIEETPAPGITRELRARMGEAAIRAASSARYTSAGTVEFLLTREGDFYFLEMNTRIQVEHPVTELVSGRDLIREMVFIAAGERMSPTDSLLDPDGHAIEVRVNAEDPHRDFRPAPAKIAEIREPGGIGVRVDSGISTGYVIPGDYDSLLAKIIVWAPDRPQARLRALRALDETRIEGPTTTLQLAEAVLKHPTFAAGGAGTTFLAGHLEELLAATEKRTTALDDTAQLPRGEPRVFEVEVNRKFFHVNVAELKPESRQRPQRAMQSRHRTAGSTELSSPMHGTVIDIRRNVGDVVGEGDALVIIEAMKMENEISAHRAGTVKKIDVVVGDTVEVDQRLAVIE